MLPILFKKNDPILFNKGMHDIASVLDSLFETSFDFDAWEEDEKLHLTFNLPGFDKGSVSVVAEDGVVTIEASKEDKDDGKRKWIRRSSRSSYHNSVRIPDVFDASNAQAEYKDGVLTVTMEKAKDKRSRNIKVK